MRTQARLPIFLIYFLDNFGFAIAFPLFSTLILSSDSFHLPSKYSLMMHNMLYGSLSGAFALGMFLGAPVLGNLSDFLGRKPAIRIALGGILVGNLITTLALHLGSYYFLIASRLFTGLFSANFTLCHAALADLSPTAAQRSKNFGLLAAISGLSWGLALILGSLLTQSSFPLSPTLPFLSAAALAGFNLLLVFFLYPETAPLPQEPYQFVKGFDLVTHTFRSRKNRKVIASLLLFSTGWLISLQWFGGFSLQYFEISQSRLITAFLCLGGSWILSAALLNRFLINRVALSNIPLYSLLLLAGTLSSLGFLKTHPFFTLINAIALALCALILCNLLALLSLSTTSMDQGKSLGLGQAVLGASQFLAPVFGTAFLLGGLSRFYFYVAALVLGAFFFFLSELNFLKKTKSHAP